MTKEASLSLLFISFLIFFSSGINAFSSSSGPRFFQKSKISKSQIHKTRNILEATTGFPTNPASTSPTIITVPSTNQGVTTPVTVPSTAPPTNPVTVPGTQPVNSYPPPSPISGTVPVTNPQIQPPPSNTNPQIQPPPSNTNPQPSQGGSWCVAKTGIPQTTLQTALDYACGTKGVDCSQIQQGGSCYNPNSLQNHASFAFNSYYLKNPATTSCDFGGVATIVSINPSSGTCIFPSSSGGAGSSGSSSGITQPSVGLGPQTGPLDSSHSTGLRPLLLYMILVILSVTWKLGVKDASDKKILVDMLFWAVDNPAPANYLLISGDRDFSNALHQLRMRRYNILLAQPLKASAPLVAAANSVWLWTSLLAGGSPVTSVESQQLDTNSLLHSSETLQIPFSNAEQTQQQGGPYSEVHAGHSKFQTGGRGFDSRYQGGPTWRNPSQPNGSKAMNPPPVGLQDNRNNVNNYRPVNNNPNVPLSGSATIFVRPNSDHLWSNNGNQQGNHQNPHSQSSRPNGFPLQPPFAPSNLYSPNPHTFTTTAVPPRTSGPPNFSTGSPTTVLDMGNLNITGYPNNVHNPRIVPQRSGELKQNPKSSAPLPVRSTDKQNGHMMHSSSAQGYPHGPEYQPTLSATMGGNKLPANGKWGSSGCPKPSEYVQGLIGVVLLTLNSLKNAKIMPTEANITESIRYGDPKHRNADVKKALESAMEQQMVVKQNLGALTLYIGKNDKLWKCVNPLGGNPKQHPKEIWDEIQKFLTTPAGRSAIMGTQCKYEAVIVIKNMCFKDLALGDVFQILNILITHKKWIVHQQSGWQPLIITLPESNPDSGATSDV